MIKYKVCFFSHNDFEFFGDIVEANNVIEAFYKVRWQNPCINKKAFILKEVGR